MVTVDSDAAMAMSEAIAIRPVLTSNVPGPWLPPLLSVCAGDAGCVPVLWAAALCDGAADEFSGAGEVRCAAAERVAGWGDGWLVTAGFEVRAPGDPVSGGCDEDCTETECLPCDEGVFGAL